MDRPHAPPRPPGADAPAGEPVTGRRRLDLLLRLSQDAGAGAADRIRPRERGAPAPLSSGQERFWLLARLDPASPAYTIRAAYRLPRVELPALERALGQVVRRHESLRTVFAETETETETEGGPVQVVAPFDGFALPVEEVAGADDAAREAAMLRRARDEAARPFDLAAGPLFRPRLLRLGGDDVLLLTMHHAIGDRWSLDVLVRELRVLYEAYRDGRDPPLPEPALQYADFAAWQRERLRGDGLAGEVAWWRQRLAGAPARLELSTDHPRPPARTDRGGRVTGRIPAELLERLRALGRGEGATLFMVLLGAFQLLLARYTGGDDVVVGTPVAGRSRREVEGMIGFFVNMLVLRTGMAGDPTFREVLRRAREATLGAYEHQELPFEKLVAELQPERSLSRSPLFQVVFTLEAEGGGADGWARSVAVDTGTAQFDLTLTAVEAGGVLTAVLDYSADLFERATAERMLGHLVRVLERVTADPGVRISRIALAGADERRMLVEAWNQTDRPFPRGACIHELFDSHVRERPDVPALAWGDERWTYAELGARANRLAHHLAALGVGPESRVGVMLERGPDLIISILAVLKAGGCYVPLDPAYPAERLRLMRVDAGIHVLITRNGLSVDGSDDASVDGSEDASNDVSGDADEAGLRVVSLEGEAGEIASRPADAPISGATADNLAYIVYTSGSTGRPKGVMVAHRHVVQLVRETDYVRLAPGDRVAQASNASFDALAFETWGALLNGATLVGIPKDILLSPPALRDALREWEITTLYQTTALLNQLSREQADVFSALREVLFGGQAADAESVRRILRGGKPARLLHMYGPTETTAWCSWEDVHALADDAIAVSVGRPTGNARIYLLDTALQPVPVGLPGEAYVGGAGVVRGYLDRPALTAERFIPDPFSGHPGARMYRTGDRLRWKTGGALEFLGRLDEQVKVRGFRIEPGEVESVLSTHPEVREARVVAREDVPGEQRLVAYVVGVADPEALRAHLRRRLPEHMVPSAFVALPRIPLTPAGKLDRAALPAPDFAADEARHVAPRTPVEEVLAGIWAEVLCVERVGATDGFFELGGHSLLATRVVSRIRGVLGVELPLRAMFEGPTLAELAERVEALRRADVPALPPVVPVPRDGPLPLSFAQERLWFLDRMEPGSAFYNVPSALRLTGPLDAAALERALGEIVQRHEALRTVFGAVDGSPVQVIAPFRGFALAVDDLSPLDEPAREREVTRQAGDEAVRPFDLAAGPLFRARLLRLGDGEHVLLVSMHHVVSDGWSVGVLFRELAALYEAYRDGGEASLPPLPVQYADYAVWQREQLRGEVLDRQLGYWRERLAGAPALLELPTDRPRPPLQAYEGDVEWIDLPPELVDGLRALGRGEGATLYMVLLGAFQLLLGRYAASDDVVVGSPIAGRTRREVEELIGFFVNTLVLRTDLSGDPSFRALLGRVREVTLGAYEHQDVPFERLVAELRPERSLSHSPLFQVMFVMDGGAAAPASLPGLRTRGVPFGIPTVKHDLALGLVEHAGGIRAELAYGAALFDRATIQRTLHHLRRVLEQVAAAPEAPLSRVALLVAAERARVVEEWNRVDDAGAAPRCIHRLFEARARRTAGAPAVTFESASLTYGELNARANRLAHHLARHGVGPEVRVGLCLERGMEMVVAILAVLKAGGAYVPLDPGYPAERLAYVLDDSGVAVLLTEEALRGTLPVAPGVRVVSVDGAAGEIAAERADDFDGGAGPGNLAYVIYTSGSTGAPKGALIEHRQVARLFSATDAWFGFGPGDVWTLFHSYAFDFSVWELWGALLHGGRVVVVPFLVSRDPDAFHALVAGEGVTVLSQTPSAFRHFARVDAERGGPLALRLVVFGGEALEPATLRGWVERRGAERPRLVNMYGITETTVHVTFRPIAAEDVLGGAGSPIGRRIPDLRIYVLDRAMEPVPVGVPGELYVGGAGVARGYLGRPALTGQRFVPNPFAPGRLYRTGDRARWLGDGTLDYLGRADDQVKVRGFRIEPGEIEAALRGQPGVADCVVVARPDEAGEARLVAYVAGAADPEVLRAHLRRVLPGYMVPAAFVVLDRLPHTPSGKLDRRALPAPVAVRAAARLKPGTGMEARLAAIWGELLGVDAVGAEDNFFDLGGHSLLLVRLQARLAAELGSRIRVVELFQHPTVRTLAARLQGEGNDGAVEEGGERGGARQAALNRRLERRRRDG